MGGFLEYHRSSPVDWISDNLRIITKEGKLVNLRPNIGQLMLNSSIRDQQESGNPVRIILLKPRQVGWSTWSEAYGFYQINTRPQWTALVVSDDLDSTDLIFNMTKLFQAEMPSHLRRRTDSSNRKEIIYSAPWRSKFLTQTAGKDVLGRGGTIQYLHCSEVAWWPRAQEGLAAVLQQVPKTLESVVILESTANGVGGPLYDRFWQAVDRRQNNPRDYSGYIPVFFPWYKFPEYSTKCPLNFRANEEEEELRARFGLMDGQIWWRRLKIQELADDESLFKQEYPATAREAFQVSGRSVFSQSLLDKMEKRLNLSEIRYGLMTGHVGNVGFESVTRQKDCWQIRYFPQEGHEYTHGTDVMEGEVSDTANERSKPDWHGSVVFDRDEQRVAAIFHGRCDVDELGRQCVLASDFYNEAWATPEINDAGFAVLSAYKKADYRHIYQRQKHDEQLVAEDTPQLGWKTTSLTRQWLVDTLKTAVRNGEIEVSFPEIIQEMRTFVVDKAGKSVHLPGEHDDLLFGLMIALQLHLRCPLNPEPYPYATTGTKEEKVHQKSLSTIGAVDDWEPEDEMDDDYTY